MTMAASARFEFRLRPETKRQVEQAAALLHQNTSDFARAAVEERAERVLQEHSLWTVVPATFFDELLAALDEPPVVNETLARAACQARVIIERR